MVLSRKRNNQLLKRNSNRLMVGHGDSYDPKLDAALTCLNLYSRTLIETNDDLADYVEECIKGLLPAYKLQNESETLSQVQNYLNGNVSELESNMFNSGVEVETLCKELGLDSARCVKALFALCIANLVEREMRHMVFEKSVGGSPFGKKRRATRALAQAVVAGVGAWQAGVAVAATATTCAVGAGATACALAYAPAVAVGVAVGYSGYYMSYHLVNGVYVAGTAAYRGIAGAGGEFAAALQDIGLNDPLDDTNPHAVRANANIPWLNLPAWINLGRVRRSLAAAIHPSAPGSHHVPAPASHHVPAPASHHAPAAAHAGAYPEFSSLNATQKAMVNRMTSATGCTVDFAIAALVDNHWQAAGNRRRSSIRRSRRN